MAERQKQGWVWSAEDRFPAELASLERKAGSVRTQLERFESVLPGFAAEARTIGGAFLASVQPLVALWKARKRKYRPLSPDEAEQGLVGVRRAEEAWAQFIGRDDVQDGIRKCNREAAAAQRKKREIHKSVRSTALQEVETPIFRGKVREFVMQYLQEAAAGVDLAMAMHKFGEPQHRELLQRLFAVNFVRFSYFQSKRRAEMMEEYLQRTPTASMHDVAFEAAMNVVREGIQSYDAQSPVFSAKRRICGIVHMTMEAFMNLVKEWANKKKTPDDLDQGYFTICEVDYSLEAHPE